MKKQILILGLSLLTTAVFAKESKTKETKKEAEPVTKCCTRSASSGSGRTYVSVSITFCVTSQSGNSNAASAMACSIASQSANDAIGRLKNATYTFEVTQQ
jgi:hypothetical protein